MELKRIPCVASPNGRFYLRDDCGSGCLGPDNKYNLAGRQILFNKSSSKDRAAGHVLIEWDNVHLQFVIIDNQSATGLYVGNHRLTTSTKYILTTIGQKFSLGPPDSHVCRLSLHDALFDSEHESDLGPSHPKQLRIEPAKDVPVCASKTGILQIKSCATDLMLENEALRQQVKELQHLVTTLKERVRTLEEDDERNSMEDSDVDNDDSDEDSNDDF